MCKCMSVQDMLASEVYNVISQTSIFPFVGRCQPVRDNGPVGIVQLLLEKNADIHKAGQHPGAGRCLSEHGDLAEVSELALCAGPEEPKGNAPK